MKEQRNQISIFIPWLFLILCYFCYALPTLRALVVRIDTLFFYLLNGSLEFSRFWAFFWFCLNHNLEKTLNLVAFLIVSFYIIFREPKKTRKILSVNLLALIIFMQLSFLIKDSIFVKILELKRESPSMLLSPFINLADMFASNDVKMFSGASFPGGHAFSASFWAILTCCYAPKRYWPLVWIVAIPIIMNRLFSGAHWLSDVVVGVLLAWAMATTFYHLYETYILQKIKLRINRD